MEFFDYHLTDEIWHQDVLKRSVADQRCDGLERALPS